MAKQFRLYTVETGGQRFQYVAWSAKEAIKLWVKDLAAHPELNLCDFGVVASIDFMQRGKAKQAWLLMPDIFERVLMARYYRASRVREAAP